MKPLYLKMRAFGPYSDVQTVDFTAFGDSPMFLINGPTGAGKSTILDAICFAFYGTTSDKTREASGMRNAQAGSSVLTEVELTFELANQRWKVRRIPHQKRAKNRGEGYTEQKPEGQLYSIDKQGKETVVVPKKHTEVTRKIIELTGLNDEQFRQVMVLPQGQFRALLLAKSNEREDILSTLFGTTTYKQIEERLKESASEIRVQSESYKSRVLNLLTGLEVENQAELKEKISTLQPELKKQRKFTQELEGKFEDAIKFHVSSKELVVTFSQLESLDAELAKIQALDQVVKEKQQLIDKNEKGKTIAKHYNSWQLEKQRYSDLTHTHKGLSTQLTGLGESLEVLELQNREADRRVPESEEKKLRLAKLEKFSEQLVKLKPHVSRLDEVRLKVESLKVELTQIESPLARRKKEEQTLLILTQSLQRDLQGASEVKAQNLKLEHCYEQHGILCQKVEQNKACDKELMQCRTESNRQNTLVAEIQNRMQTLEYQWHLSQAGILARTLDENVPCPVCGSKEHPIPADQTDTLVDKEQIDLIRKQLRGKEKDLQLLESRMAAITQQGLQLEKDIRKLRLVLDSVADQTLNQTEKQLKGAKKKMILLDENLIRLRRAEKDMSQVKLDIDNYEKQYTQLSSSIQSTNELQIKLKAELETSLTDIPEAERDPSTLKAEYRRLKGDVDQQAREYLLLTKKLDAERQRYQKTVAKYEASVDQITVCAIAEKKMASVWKNAIENSVFVDEKDYLASVLADQDTISLKKEVEEHVATQAKVSGAREQLLQNLAGRVKPNMVEVENSLENIRAERNLENKKFKETENYLNQLVQLKQKLDDLEKKHEILQKKYGVVGRLSHIASGQPPARVNFQRFVLGVLLDDVLVEASTRLNTMTQGRYLLKRSGGVAGNRVTGLDLDITDSYTGQQRPVSTLSGGESFLAALALALGLSDVVQAYAGGIRLDTLFIDEGFGSLDPEALNLAVQTLVDLQSRGRMIGVISHVDQMKEQIPKRIDIKAGISGSQLSLVS